MKGSEVKKIIKSIGCSQIKIAENMNVKPQVLASMLRTSDIKTGVLERIAKAAGKDIFFFLGKPETDTIQNVDIKYEKIYTSMLEASNSIKDFLLIFKK